MLVEVAVVLCNVTSGSMLGEKRGAGMEIKTILVPARWKIAIPVSASGSPGMAYRFSTVPFRCPECNQCCWIFTLVKVCGRDASVQFQ